jgi:5-methylcytosine-specific restriction endonuclease McrA
METLVLSAGWEPLQVIPWQRAMTLMFMGKVEILEEYRDKHIRTVSVTLQMPAVVRFLKVLKTHKRSVKFSRQNVYARDKGRCQYCGHIVPRHDATYDHVLPRAQGGTTRWENVVIACVDCNQRKANRTPVQAHMRMLSVPVKPKHLPGAEGFMLTYKPGMPVEWTQFLTDTTYWYGKLESE